jgi:hypothetical protein
MHLIIVLYSRVKFFYEFPAAVAAELELVLGGGAVSDYERVTTRCLVRVTLVTVLQPIAHLLAHFFLLPTMTPLANTLNAVFGHAHRPQAFI